MKIEIIDNFLTPYYSDIFIKTFDGKNSPKGFPWYFTNDLNDVSYWGNYYFVNKVIGEDGRYNSEWHTFFNPLFDGLKIARDKVYRLKVNLYPGTQRRIHHASHEDYQSNCGLRTALYYVNTNNGVTIFDGKKTVKSKENRIILFDGSTKHHSTTPTDTNYRCTINIDYIL
tara:strand:+ start:51 stop:563 length:513 start_codon:yes stop_codon:yes gene_type:complete